MKELELIEEIPQNIASERIKRRDNRRTRKSRIGMFNTEESKSEESKLDRIQIRCTTEEKKEFSDLAKARGMNTSEFLRALINVYKGEVNKESLNVDINEGIDRVIKELELLKIK